MHEYLSFKDYITVTLNNNSLHFSYNADNFLRRINIFRAISLESASMNDKGQFNFRNQRICMTY
jgi:hypothetical protein